ncbi:MAG: fatty acid desaturase [Acidimicrobiales bacterium]
MSAGTTKQPSTDRPTAIRHAAEHRGAPSVPVWLNPTIWMFVAFLVTSVASLSYLWGAVPAWAAIALGVLARYLAFTVMHEASHRVAHGSRRVNDFLGWPTGLVLTVTLPMFRSCHTKHHSYTNQPEIDPDFDVGRSPRWLRPLWLVSPLWTYRARYFGLDWAKTQRDRWIQIAVDVVIVAMIVAAIATGHAVDLLVVFVVPLFVSLALLTLAFDLIPHLPYDSTERFHDTRALPSRTLNVLFLGQNYHLVHHLWNSVPWYKYQRVFSETRDDLAAVGARVDWGD